MSTLPKKDPFVITGPVGGAPNRLEIYDFVKDKTMFSLFIQALSASQCPFFSLTMLTMVDSRYV